MAGTVAGGAKCALTNKSKYGEDFYKSIGKLGGQNRHPKKGFGSNIARASKAGQLGGMKSRRTFTDEQRLVQSLRMQKWHAEQ